MATPTGRRQPPALGSNDDALLWVLVRAIVADERAEIATLRSANPNLAKQSFGVGATRASAGGANPALKNKNGSSVTDLATQNTGRGGTGAAEAKREQEAILRLLKDAL